jgi:hypothetical protein
MEFRVSEVAYEPSAYLRSQYNHRRKVQPLRGAVISMTEEEQKRRGEEARGRLIGKPPKPLMAARIPTISIPVENYAEPTPEPVSPVDNLEWGMQAEPVVYDDSLSPALAMQVWREIVKQVALKHGVSFMDIISPRRQMPVVLARHEAMYRLKNETPASYPRIGKWLGGRDHTTCLHGIRMHKQRNGIT